MTQALAPLIAYEAFAVAATVLLFPLGLRKRKKTTLRAREQKTVVFIHGYLANRSSFLPIAGYLAVKGRPSQLHFEYSSQESIEQSAIRLKAFLKKHVRGGRIDLVCHSLGGLVARAYLQLLGGSRRVDRCVTIATPHQGTYNAYWLWSRVARDLRPESTILKRLQSTSEKAGSVKFLSIGGGAERIVLPPQHTEYSESHGHFPNLGHQGLLFHPAVFRSISNFLKD